MMMRTALYRHFDKHGLLLLYVGISNDVARRSDQHAARAGWAALIARIGVEHHDTREEALEAEGRATRSERPAFSIRGQARPVSWAILDIAKGRADGWYAKYEDIVEMMDFYKAEFPDAVLVVVPKGSPRTEECREAILAGRKFVDAKYLAEICTLKTASSCNSCATVANSCTDQLQPTQLLSIREVVELQSLRFEVVKSQ